jgi:dolichol-phosphate mannosyltransferase
MKYNLGLVVPTYNESENILNLMNLLVDNLNTKEIVTKVLIMDDSSPDGTSDIVKEYIQNNVFDNISFELKTRPGKQGLATAYTQGFSYLIEQFNPTYVMSIDADLSHNPKYIYPMYETIIESQSDLLIGSRYVKGGGVENWGPVRKFISRGGSLYSKLILSVNINDLTGGFNLYKSTIFQKLKLEDINASGYLFQIEMKYRTKKLGFKVNEFPIIFTDRVNGQSKMSKSIFAEALIGVIKLKTKI